MELFVTILVAMSVSSIFKVHAQTTQILCAMITYPNILTSEANFSGVIPQTLGNLTSLQYLDLRHCYGALSLENFQWISGLLLLQHRDLSCVDLSQSSNWLQMTSMLPSLVELHLRHCQLDLSFSLLGLNFTSLVVLDLSANNFNPLMPNWLFGLTGLDSLVLPDCGFSGPIPNGLQSMTSLRDLNLSSNYFNSTIPIWLYNFKGLKSLNLHRSNLRGPITEYHDLWGGLCNTKFIDFSHNKFGDKSDVFRSLTRCILDSLKTLSLSECQLSGSFDDNLAQFKTLQELDLSGIVSETHFANLKNLKLLDAPDNSLIFKVSPTWIPPFQLDEIFLRSCHLGPRNIPTWFWNLSSGIGYLNLSHNQIHGDIPYIPKRDDHSQLVRYLSSNQFSGPLPTISPRLVELDLSNNSFSGDMTHFLCGRSNETIEFMILILREIFFINKYS
ncbi:hypothetical protein ACSBR2_040530 [Camellia fascicularis]